MYKNHPDYIGARVQRDQQISPTRGSVNPVKTDFSLFRRGAICFPETLAPGVPNSKSGSALKCIPMAGWW
jgi:hypothetical protein